MRKIAISALYAVLCLNSCERVDSDRQECVPLRLSLSEAVSEGVGSKAPITPGTDSEWPAGTYSFGVLVCDADGRPQMDNYDRIQAQMTKEQARTIWYYKWASTSFQSELSILKGSEANIYAYYPYVSGLADSRAVRFSYSDQTDWMWATPVHLTAEETSGQEVSAELMFHHVMTCIEISINTIYSGYALVSATLTDMSDGESCLVSEGTFDVGTGEIVSGSQTFAKSLSFDPIWVSNTSNSFNFLIPPIPAEKLTENEDGELNLQLSFTINDIESGSKFRIPAKITKKGENGTEVNLTDTGFERGVRYRYNFKINNISDFEPIEAEVVDWTVATDEQDFII